MHCTQLTPLTENLVFSQGGSKPISAQAFLHFFCKNYLKLFLGHL
uniref:Uncharacterized protein n=1 Tax=Anguilla anguilla TaxID=7936 RepID=A0A0E9TGQ7_ANGAN